MALRDWGRDANLVFVKGGEIERMGIPEEKRKGRKEYVVQNRAKS